ncbi:MAG: CRISPR-associated protein Csx16 [Rhodocyclaceae bacterium]|nr:CRISPR-associated protein Csx16 [Rhodocyclaceae bacterium]
MATTWLITRHPGAVEWMRRCGIRSDVHIPHLDIAKVSRGDTVIGTLPVQLIAKICEREARYLHLSLNIPAEWRGKELSADELEKCAATLEGHYARKTADEI